VARKVRSHKCESSKESNETGAVDGIKIEDMTEFFCQACVMGKQIQKSHPPSKQEKAEKPGKMIHSDVWGLM